MAKKKSATELTEKQLKDGLNKAMSEESKAFDPEGDGYDMESAKKAGMKPNPKTGHWGSRNPKTGQILKGQKHDTYHLAVDGEKKMGFEIRKGKDGKYYSFKPSGNTSKASGNLEK